MNRPVRMSVQLLGLAKKMPRNEACEAVGVVGETVFCVQFDKLVQMYKDGKPLGIPISTEDAGLLCDGSGYYFYEEV